MKSLGFINDYYYLNNTLKEVASEHYYIEEELSVYEVVKIISGIPLFFESHIQRLLNSLKISNISGFSITPQEFLQQVKELCEANNMHFGNVELRVMGGNVCKCLLGFIPHKYPQPLNYINGVSTSLIKLERDKPNAKVKHSNARIKANEFLDKNSAFEVLLVDNNNYITEGSRSNMFYIKGDSVYTAPIKHVLPGITRKFVIKALENMKISFEEQLLSVSDLNTVDATFICGTSPGIMPICKIDNYELDVKNKLLRSVMLEFNEIIKQYVVANQNRH